MTRPTTPGVRAIDAVNIEDEGFRDALAGGVTAAVIKPGSGNVIGGLSVALKTWGGRTIDEQVIAPEVSVKSALGRTRSGCMAVRTRCHRPGWVLRLCCVRRL